MAGHQHSMLKLRNAASGTKVAPVEIEDNKQTRTVSRSHEETLVYKALSALRISLLLGGLIFKKEFSKTGIKRHLTVSHVYSFIVLLFLSVNTLRWLTMFRSNEMFCTELFMKMVVCVFCLQSLTHFVLFIIASESHERLPDFFLEWEKIGSQCSQTLTSISLISNRCTVILWTVVICHVGACSYLTLYTDLQDMLLTPWDENFKYAIVIWIINTIQQFYLVISWVASSAVIFVISISLAREFRKINLSVKKLSSADPVKLAIDFETIRQTHQKLCNLVVSADAILSKQMACGLSGSMLISCLMIYFTIYHDTGYENNGLVLATKIFWIVAPLGKVILDCVSGTILNGAVRVKEYGFSYSSINVTKSLYYINQSQLNFKTRFICVSNQSEYWLIITMEHRNMNMSF